MAAAKAEEGEAAAAKEATEQEAAAKAAAAKAVAKAAQEATLREVAEALRCIAADHTAAANVAATTAESKLSSNN